ncbi:MAG: hypothetical protein HOI72_04340 [Candidatus Marinimicrobia bacterium]|jgi:hypothetical protein|nr:hypothetical protein [Candidatus Neomarinimicrobiota bacterium]MBT3847819.1 hypothetical protein [Candidatus Neomarinimicrobiota bacterium]MBT4053497.1 hypothetical protein [Candidatus Neomarinimicrobiota bacterium]MBT4661756.1 hypothetical protein [Candidatus Neomarinimicrobiota bacterium]MBT4828592.1 hypothetical protein [Candidatus Neomarinimicrobiota bacterium]
MKSLDELKHFFKLWEIVKDLIDQCIDIMLNLRQSEHTGGSGSNVYTTVVKLFSLSVFTTAI